MTYAERKLVETYSMMFKGLSPLSKIELIERLTKSLKKDKMEKVDTFYRSFGAFSSEKTPEEIVKEIKSSRKFKNLDIKF